jgi:hypothetical protein
MLNRKLNFVIIKKFDYVFNESEQPEKGQEGK